MGPADQSVDVLCRLAEGRKEKISLAQKSKAHESDPKLTFSKPRHMNNGPVLIPPTHVLDEEIEILPEACFDDTKPPLPGLNHGIHLAFSMWALCSFG